MMTPLTITPRQAAQAHACLGSFRRMARNLRDTGDYGRDTPVPISRVLDELGLDDAVWALDAIGADKTLRLFAADCAEHVLPIFECYRPDDRRPREAVRVAKLRVHGLAAPAAWAAAWAAARDAARDAARAAARDAARAAAWAAAGAAAGAAARDAAWAAARDAARDAAWDAAREAEREWQTRRLREHVTGGIA